MAMNEQRKTGIAIIGDVPWGTHICQFYQTKDDLLDILVPYFKAGLENNEFCMWGTSEPLSVDEATRALQVAVPELDTYLETGQIEILDYSEWYNTKSGKFEAKEVLQGWVEKERHALKNGFDGLRLSSNTFWLEKEDGETFTEYEAAINGIIGNYQMLALCSYSLDRCGAVEVIEVVKNPQFVLIRRAGAWEELTGSAEHRRTEEALKESEMLYRSIVENTQDIIYSATSDGIFTYVSPQVSNYGYTPEEIIGHSLFEFIAPEDVERVYADFQRCLALGKEAPIEFRIVKNDGTFFDVEERDTFIREGEQIVGLIGVIRDITERKRGEEKVQITYTNLLESQEAALNLSEDLKNEIDVRKKAMEELERLYRMTHDILEKAPFGILVVDSKGIVEYVNPAMITISGATEADFEGLNLLKLPTYEKVGLADNIRAALRGESFFMAAVEYTSHFANKRTIRNFTGIPLEEAGERKALIIVEDITELKDVESALRASELQLAQIISFLPDATFAIDRDGKVIAWNMATEEMTGIKHEDMIGKGDYEYALPFYGTRRPVLVDLVLKPDNEVKEKYQPFSKEGDSIVAEVDTSLGGKEVHLWGKARPIYDLQGEVIGAIESIRDLTDRKRADDALRESEKKLRLVTDQVTDVVWSLDLQWNFTFVTPSVERITGYTVDEILSLNFKQLITPESYKTAMERINQRMKVETHEPVTVEIEQIRKDGSRVWCEVTAILVVDQNNRPTGIVGVTRDITERKQAEEALRTSEAQLSNAMKIAQLGYWEYDVANDLFTFNDHFYAIFRTSVEQVGGYTMSSARYAQLFVHPDDMAVVGIEIRKAIESTDPHYSRQLEHRIIYADGEIGYIAVRFFIIKDNQGRTVKTYGANQDITERKLLADERERYLKELEQRNAEMERFVYTISHELRTPLVTLQGYSDLVQRDLERNDKTRVTTDLTFIQNAVTSMGQLLQDTLKLSRTGRVMNPPVDVPFGAVIRDALAQLAELIKWSGAKVSMAEDFPTVHVDRMRIVEVLVNLIENSIKFMGDQPKPKIEIGYRTEDKETVFFVKDNGIGLDPSQHKKVFQLFYKVDKKSKGSGAGLAIVKRIIEVHNGRIWVESEEGKGCTVCFTLPVL